MTIPGWLIVLIIALFGIRQILRHTKSIRRINKTEKINKTLDEIETELQMHNKEIENVVTKPNIIQFPSTHKE